MSAVAAVVLVAVAMLSSPAEAAGGKGPPGPPIQPPPISACEFACLEAWMNAVSMCQLRFCTSFLLVFSICDSPEYAQCYAYSQQLFEDCIFWCNVS